MGVNLGEAVNFAPADWLRFGAASLAHYRHFRRPCVVSHEEMVLQVGLHTTLAAAAAAVNGCPPPSAAAAVGVRWGACCAC